MSKHDVYKLEINGRQAAVIALALELYARAHIGQLNEISWQVGRYIQSPADVSKARDHLEMASKYLFPDGSPSMTNPKVPESARIAWDIQQVIRHRRSWDDNPGGGITTNFDEPMKLSKVPLPKMEKHSLLRRLVDG